MAACAIPTGPDAAKICMTLGEAMGGTQVETAMRSNFSRMAEQAIGTAVTRPEVSGSAIDGERARLTGLRETAVGDEKHLVVSDVARPGAQPKTAPADQQDSSAALEARVKELYLGLTNYQVAWKIAQRMQQDTSQLLRGQ